MSDRENAKPSFEDIVRPCRTRGELHEWCKLFAGANVPRRAVCPDHDAPFDYLCRAYFEPAVDQVVWAPRGGGKTRLGALATLLDLLHKPGLAVRILGGSLEQSLRMWEHLLPDLEQVFAGVGALRREGNRHRLRLPNGSGVAILPQSQRAVRGLRVQKLRCDEVELFDTDVWEAAQLITKSRVRERVQERPGPGAADPSWSSPEPPTPNPETSLGPPDVAGVVEAFSTMHAPFGLMGAVLDKAQANGTPVVRWCLLEVLEQCPPERDCATCPLWDECRGVAKTACEGFVRIDDAIAMKRRVSLQTWESEMLCRRPAARACVFPAFDPDVHVREGVGGCEVGVGGCEVGVGGCELVVGSKSHYSVSNSQPPTRNSQLPTLNSRPPTRDSQPPTRDSQLSLAIDFGFAAPFVCLWVVEHQGTDEARLTHVIDEYVQELRPIHDHLQVIESRPWGRPRRIACDPAGASRNDQTSVSNVSALRAAGYVVKHRRSRIVEGLEMVRAALRPALGAPRLFVHPRCARLIKALRAYRYGPSGGELPIKDGEHDHLIDALRYHFVNRTSDDGPTWRWY